MQFCALVPSPVLTRAFLPLLYNRRHAGVTLFLLAVAHTFLVVATYYAAGDVNPFLGIFAGIGFNGSVSGVPFQVFGFIALFILFLMAATSHDFWLRNLTAPVWKSLHMLVYFAYGLLVLHVVFGVLQSETNPLYAIATGLGLATVLTLHWLAGRQEKSLDDAPAPAAKDGYVDVCAVDEIPENRAKVVCISGERVAVFKHGGKISAVSNVCQHQNGPLGEGKIVSGCITCPWHGYQYLPETGASPPPFVEKVSTFNSRVQNGRVLVRTIPNPPGAKSIQGTIATP